MRACVLAYLATAATATRVLSGGGLPSLNPRTFGRRPLLPVPAADKTMTVGDYRQLKVDFSRTVWRDKSTSPSRPHSLTPFMLRRRRTSNSRPLRPRPMTTTSAGLALTAPSAAPVTSPR